MPQIVRTPDGQEHEFPDGATPEQMRSALSRYVSSESTRSTAPGQQTGAASAPLAAQSILSTQPPQPWWQEYAPAITGAVGEMALPAAIGAARGAPLGPWGALGAGILGAGLGAVPGSLIRQGASPDVAATTQDMMMQGGASAVGLPIGLGMGWAARNMMQGALKPTLRSTRASNEVVKDALKQGATVFRGPRGGGSQGAEKVRSLRGQATSDLLATADKSGVKGRLQGILPKASEFVSPQSPRLAQETAEAQKILDEYLGNHPMPKKPSELKAMKDDLWKRANGIFPKLQEGKQVRLDSPDVPLEARVYYGAARRINEAMRKGIKGFGQAEDATKRSIGVASAVRNAEDVARSGVPALVPQTVGRGAMASLGGYGGWQTGETPGERVRNALIGTAAGSAIGHPWFLSRAAHVPNNEFLQWLFSQAPRSAGAIAFPPDSP